MNCNFVRLFTAVVFAVFAFAFSPFVASFDYGESVLLARLFQILFFLFIISPPLIVVMLYLILKELRARNKMK
jgi:hypothetical protein